MENMVGGHTPEEGQLSSVTHQLLWCPLMSHLPNDFDPHVQGDVQNPMLLPVGECTVMTRDSQLTPHTSCNSYADRTESFD